MTDPLRALLHDCHLLPPADLPAIVAAHAASIGVRETVLYLADYEQARLVPLRGTEIPERDELAIQETVAGRVFRSVEIVGEALQPQGHRMWLPLLDGVERLGVVEFVMAEEPEPEELDLLRAFATLVAEVLVVRDAYSDVFARRRRRKPLSLAAEMQWDLLPPLTFATDRVVITGGLEPAYDIGGDSFDYAFNESTADLLVIDAMGHGLSAALLAVVAVGAYRNARRNGLDLPAVADAIDTAIAEHFGRSEFVTAVLARLDVDDGRLRWINAGHPPPLVLREGSLVHLPHGALHRPLGLLAGTPTCSETWLEPGDRLLLYTDGITEARSRSGEFFGEHRLADLIGATAADGEPAPETVRRLLRQVLEHQAGQLQDDASVVVLEWLSGGEERTLP